MKRDKKQFDNEPEKIVIKKSFDPRAAIREEEKRLGPLKFDWDRATDCDHAADISKLPINNQSENQENTPEKTEMDPKIQSKVELSLPPTTPSKKYKVNREGKSSGPRLNLFAPAVLAELSERTRNDTEELNSRLEHLGSLQYDDERETYYYGTPVSGKLPPKNFSIITEETDQHDSHRKSFIPPQKKLPQPNVEATKRCIEWNTKRGQMQMDSKRGMPFFGKSLDELESVPPSIPDCEIKGEDGKVVGVVFNLGKKK